VALARFRVRRERASTPEAGGAVQSLQSDVALLAQNGRKR
jgi:hypothetical protein